MVELIDRYSVNPNKRSDSSDLFYFQSIYNDMSKNFMITEAQLKRLVEDMKTETTEGSDGNYMAKQQLFTIAVTAYKMWESMEDNETNRQLSDREPIKVAVNAINPNA